MKAYKNLYPQVTAFENLYRAYRLARRGKRHRAAVADFEYNLEGNLLRLQEELQAQTYRPGAYHNFIIFEPKRRLVSAAPLSQPGCTSCALPGYADLLKLAKCGTTHKPAFPVRY